MTTFGVLGVGSIAESIVIGLCSASEAPEVVLSPRNAERAARLAARFPTVEVASDNQEVLEVADVVVVCVLPAQADDVLSGLRFRADQAVVSAIANLSMARLRDLVGPAREISRSIPVPAVARGASQTPVHPATGSGSELFGRLGGTLPVAEESAFEALSAASATVAAYYDYLAAIAGWLVDHGVEEVAARRYVAARFEELGPELRGSDVDFSVLAGAHSTPGGLNEQLARELRGAGIPDAVRSGLDGLLARLLPPPSP